MEKKDVQSRGNSWGSLGDFSQTILDLDRKENEENRTSKNIRDKIEAAYFDNIVVKKHPSFKRQYIEGRPVM